MLERNPLLIPAWCVMISFAWTGTVDAELVGYWNFDGSVEDLSGTGNHGQLVGAQYSHNVPSVIGSGRALDFLEVRDHVFIEAHESLDSPTFTLAMFTYDRGGGLGNPRTTIREGGSFETATNRVPFFAGRGQYAYKPGPGSLPNAGGWTWDDTIPTLEAWQHVAYVATEANTMQIYVDGELTLEESWNGNPSGFMQIGSASGVVFDGLVDNVALWNEPLDAETIQGLAAGGSVLGERGLPPASPVGPRGAVGSNLLTAVQTNQEFSGANAKLPGLGQLWYDEVGPEFRKDAIDVVFQNNEPVVPYFQSQSGTTWWSGSDDVSGVPKYPSEVDGQINADSYSVKLVGEILIEESGTVRFFDGVDDFIFLAIDLDRSGTAGDSDAEILINSPPSLNFIHTAIGAPIVEVDFENIAEGGEWLAMEVNLAEDKTRIGQNGMLFWDALDEDDLFPLDQSERVPDFDAADLVVPDTHLRSVSEPARLVSGDAVGTVPARQVGWELDVNPADGTADTFAVENPDENVYSTVVDLDGILLTINPLGEVTDGSSFRIVEADSVVGTPIIATDGWTFDAATGSITFGDAIGCDPNTMGDLDGNGMVDFADFIILSTSFGQASSSHLTGDIDCNGMVDFADFVMMSVNFGRSVGSVSVPEPSGRALLGLAMALGLFRRRARDWFHDELDGGMGLPSL